MTYLNRTKHVKMAFDQQTRDLNYYLYLANKYFPLIHTDYYVPADPNSHHQAGNNEEEDDIAPMTLSSHYLGRADEESTRKSYHNNISRNRTAPYPPPLQSHTVVPNHTPNRMHNRTTSVCHILSFVYLYLSFIYDLNYF